MDTIYKRFCYSEHQYTVNNIIKVSINVGLLE